MHFGVTPTLDTRKISLWQWLILCAAVLVLVLDGLDIQLLAFVTPVILREWQVDRVAFAPALAAALIGMAIGSAGGGALGDRFGRRPVLIASTVLFGASTVFVGLTHDITTLTLLRLGGGLGFGAATPNAFAIATEWLPSRARARAVGVVAVAAPLGGLLGASLSMILLPAFGWRGCFIICGSVTGLLALLMLFLLPESASYLLAKGRHAEAGRLLRRVAGIEAAPTFMTQAFPAPQPPVTRASIFTTDLLRLKIGAAMAFFSCVFATYAILSWMPTILSGSGFAMPDAIRSALAFNLMAITGTLVSSQVMVRFGSKQIMMVSCASTLIAALSLIPILLGNYAQAGGLMWWILFALIGLTGLGLGGGMTTAYAIVSSGYPVDRRATGIGFGVMVGRVGGIVTVFGSSLLLGAADGKPTLFLAVVAIMMVVAIVATFVINRHVPRLQNPLPSNQESIASPDNPGKIPRQAEGT
jgi:AAHS family 4-hydroxybenzoate transporter-like MFS transporter